jgi:hypothetical protein
MAPQLAQDGVKKQPEVAHTFIKNMVSKSSFALANLLRADQSNATLIEIHYRGSGEAKAELPHNRIAIRNFRETGETYESN